MKQLILILGFILLFSSSYAQQERPVKFAVISDIHQDIMHDGEDRLQTFINAAQEQNVDFIIELGDFCFPKEENQSFLYKWNAYPGEKYHVLGNHDMDICSKEEYIAFTGMPGCYYSFDKGDFHFIVLDPNNILKDEEYRPYSKGNYFREPSINQIDPGQIEWLKKDLLGTNKRCIIFSHESLENTVENRLQIRKILEDENQRNGFKKIILAFSGHDHTDYRKEINGIAYVQVNSASNQWVGGRYACEERFSEEINKEKPSLKYTAPYKDALYGIVTLYKDSVKMKGVHSEFISPTPVDLGIPYDIYPFPLTPTLSDFTLYF